MPEWARRNWKCPREGQSKQNAIALSSSLPTADEGGFGIGLGSGMVLVG